MSPGPPSRGSNPLPAPTPPRLMHREISHAGQPFEQDRSLSLYLLTGLLGVLIGIDVWPPFAAWAAGVGVPLPSWPDWDPGNRLTWIAALLGGVRVLYSAVEALLDGRLGADLALAIAVVAALLFRKPFVAAEVVFIGLVGECLEAFTFERTRRAVARMVEIFPRRCWVIRDGQEVRVFTHEVRAGDHVVVKPGGRLPADGVVLEGRSAVDQSALTGESLPVEKSPGDEVLAGTLNQFGVLVVEARRVGEQTVAGQVVEWTARALKDKAPLERTADRLARYFLPAVLGLAALTFLGALVIFTLGLGGVRHSLADAAALALDPTLAVLVVACPCPLILATPTAVLAALGRLAGTGVLIKGSSALERLAGVTAFAFDKTGTLTEGRLVLGEITPLDGATADEVLALAASAEAPSEHVLAQLVVRAASERGLPREPVEDFEAHPGAGVTGRTATGHIVVGTRRLLEGQGVTLPAPVAELLTRYEVSGQTTLLVARSGRVVGVIGARDQVRPEARHVIAELRAAGVSDFMLLTGDRRAVADAVGEAVGIADVHAELLPQEKAEAFVRWREPAGQPPRHIAMVGDGINDAPALARADVGLAIGGTGADIAAEAGDIVLMGDPLRALPLLYRLSQQTVRVIRQNIVAFAFGVNLVGVVLTAWLWPLFATSPEWYERAPLAGVIYHQIGSLAVLLNAARLLWFERRPGRTLGRIGGWLHRLDHWLEHHLDPHEFQHWIGRHARRFGWLFAGLVIAAYLLSGVTQIGAVEVGIVRRFGRPLGQLLEPGLHWCWPRPIDDVTHVQPDRVRTIEIGFRPGAAAPSSLAWAGGHGGGTTLVPDEAVMLTGDGNLVEVQGTLRYTINRDKLEDYLFRIQDPESVLRASAESVLREVVSGRPFLDLLTTGRSDLEREVLARIEHRCEAFEPPQPPNSFSMHGNNGLGVTLRGFALHDLHPPQEVVGAYHEVTQAMETRDRLVNEAQADRTRTLRDAEAKGKQIVFRAEADALEKVRLAEADRDRFLARARVRGELSPEEQSELAPAAPGFDGRRRERVAANASLTDFRLYWDALGQALAGREKWIIDAEKVPGHRHLLLADPDQLRVPAPVIVPNQRFRDSPSEESEPPGRPP